MTLAWPTMPHSLPGPRWAWLPLSAPTLPPFLSKTRQGPRWALEHVGKVDNVPQCSTFKQCLPKPPPLWSCVEEKHGSPKVGERRHMGLSRRTLRPPPGPHTSFPGKWHQGLTGPSHVPTGLWSVRGHILLPTRCALKRFWKWKEQERVCQGAEGQGAEASWEEAIQSRNIPQGHTNTAIN